MSLVHPCSSLQRKIVGVINEIAPEKEDFVSDDDFPCFDKCRLCLVPYNLTTPHDATVCGTAFDYLARFLVAQKSKRNKEAALTDLVAGRLYTESSRWTSYGITRARGLENYQATLKKISDYIESDSLLLNDEVAELCILLAKMEQEKRGGRNERPIFDISNADKRIAEDVRQLALIFSDVFLPIVNDNSIVVFNPAFGIGSRMVGGADADIYIDGTLYDFKVQKGNSWTRKEARQLIGYYILDSIAKDVKDKCNKLGNYPIKRIARYSARYAEIDYVDVASYDSARIEATKNEIRYLYLLYNMCSCNDKALKKLGIPLTRKELLYCSEIYLEGTEMRRGYDDKSAAMITDSITKLTDFLKQSDLADLFERFIRVA